MRASRRHIVRSADHAAATHQAHQALNRAVDAAYGKKSFASDAERVAFLFELYQQYTSLLATEKKKPKRPARA